MCKLIVRIINNGYQKPDPNGIGKVFVPLDLPEREFDVTVVNTGQRYIDKLTIFIPANIKLGQKWKHGLFELQLIEVEESTDQ